MPNVQWRKLNWVSTQSAWKEAQAWRAKRQAQLEFFESQSAEALNGIATAQTNEIAGAVTITMQIAVDRVQTQAQAKVNALVKSLNKTA
jgi:hypothetical protein